MAVKWCNRVSPRQYIISARGRASAFQLPACDSGWAYCQLYCHRWGLKGRRGTMVANEISNMQIPKAPLTGQKPFEGSNPSLSLSAKIIAARARRPA
jgi:hypothetical protein